MDIRIRDMNKMDWNAVTDIHLQGILSRKSTFQSEAPSYEDWDKGYLKECRLVAVDNNDQVLGWVALSPASNHCFYRGVAEISIYIAENSRGKNIGYQLIHAAIEKSEEMGIWTLQSGIFQINEASIALHKKCGFRLVGVREKIGCDLNGVWQNTVLMERRTQKTISI